LVSDLASRQVREGLRPDCDFLGRKQVADWFELSRHVEIAQTSLRPAFDPQKKSRAGRELVAEPHELVGNRVCDLDSVIKFGLKQIIHHIVCYILLTTLMVQVEHSVGVCVCPLQTITIELNEL